MLSSTLYRNRNMQCTHISLFSKSTNDISVKFGYVHYKILVMETQYEYFLCNNVDDNSNNIISIPETNTLPFLWFGAGVDGLCHTIFGIILKYLNVLWKSRFKGTNILCVQLHLWLVTLRAFLVTSSLMHVSKFKHFINI